MAKVELKAPIVEEIKKYTEEAKSVVLISYSGITVAEDTAFRKAFREKNVVYKIYKNTLIKRAFEGTVYEGLSDALEGTTAVAFSMDDATDAAKVIADTKKTVSVLQFKAGVIDGTVYDAAGLEVIASIPSRTELISKLLGSIQSPVTNLARVLNQIAEKQEQTA
ncbi:MAG: 50S ribosomal protein L10 [Lachnospiraceae bacterium]|nr:50S ribosomal protein L10 [Lachnospiraceae bacterium]